MPITNLRTFTLDDIQALKPEHVSALTKTTLETLKVPTSGLSTITIGRNGLYPSPKDNITIEFRSNDPRNFRIGVVNYELDGTAIHVDTP